MRYRPERGQADARPDNTVMAVIEIPLWHFSDMSPKADDVGSSR